MEFLRSKLGFEGMVLVESQGRSGGLAFLWRECEQANLLSLSQHHIDMEVTVDGLRDMELIGHPFTWGRGRGKPEWTELVSEYWQELDEIDIQSKVKACGAVLEVWGKGVTGNFNKVIKECKRKWKELRNRKDDQSLQEFVEIKKKLHLTLDQREIFWRQRSNNFD
ncbi:hypothetical protein AgCh_027776 [Apium graveolens]